MDKDATNLSEDIKAVFSEKDKTIQTLAKFLELSVASIYYGKDKNNLKQCICTLSKPLIEAYAQRLGAESISNEEIDEITRHRYNKTTTSLVVYDLIEGKKRYLYLKDRIWSVNNYIVLSKGDHERLIAFVEKTWPTKTSAQTKEKIQKVK